MDSDQSQIDGNALFDKVEQSQPQINAFDKVEESDDSVERNRGSKKLKKQSKKHKKKEKKQKHKKHKHSHEYQQEDEEEEEEGGLNQFFEDQASQDDQEQSVIDSDAQLQAIQNRKQVQQIYNKKKSHNFLQKFDGKDDRQINAYYNRQAHKRRQNESMHPSENDPKVYVVTVKMGKQQDMAYCILNKSSFLNKKQPEKCPKIVSALAMRKKFPGKLFVEAFNEKDIREALQGFIDVNLGKVTQFQSDSYVNLFEQRVQNLNTYETGDYIRIKKGLYEDDLGKIFKKKKNSVDVLLVPRINIQDFLIKMKEQISKLTNEQQISKKKEQLFKKYINHKAYYPKHLRPSKKQLHNQDFGECNEIAEVQKIKLFDGGLIILSYRYDEITKLKGTFLPIQIQPFSKDGRIIDEFEEQKKHFIYTVNFNKGDEVEIIAGQLQRYYGTLVDIKQNTAVIKCKTKPMVGTLLEQPLQHIAKKFKQGEKVKVISGTDKGKTGTIIKIEDKHVELWTDNENSIKVNKNNLERNTGEVICQENIHNLKKDDLIKTSKNVIGIVLATRKDNLKILDTNNSIQIINNLDFDTKLNSKLFATKTRSGDVIKNQAIVRILKGINQGKRCQVKHVYKQFVFLFNEAFDKTSGITVEKVDNCAVISKSSDAPRKNFVNKNNVNKQEDELTVGKNIILKTGPLKGYQGIIKSINKDRIEVRVPAKACTQWVERNDIVSKQATSQIGKTPYRGMNMTHNYAPSPMSKY